MHSDQISVVAFGKRQGFEIFHKHGFAFDSEDLALEFEEFISLDMNMIQLERGQDLFASFRFSYGKNHYIFFAQFRFAPDAFARPGYYGGAVAFCNCYSTQLKNLEQSLANLTALAEAKVHNQKAPLLDIPNLAILPYSSFSFVPIEEQVPVFIDPFPQVNHFIRYTFSDALGPSGRQLFFSPDPAVLSRAKQDQFKIVNYEQGLQLRHKEQLSKQTKLKREIQEGQQKKEAIQQQNQEQEMIRHELQQEIDRLQKQHARLKGECQELKEYKGGVSADLQDLEERYDQKAKDLKYQKQTLHELKSEYNSILKINNRLNNKNELIKQRLGKKQDELDKLKISISENRNQKKELAQELKNLQQEIRTTRRDVKEQQLAALQTKSNDNHLKTNSIH